MKNVIFTITLLSIAFNLGAQSIPITGDQYHLYGPNSTWGQYLKIGGNGRGTTGASVVTTDGNLHIDSKDGKGIYLNHYSQSKTLMNTLGGFVGIGTYSPNKPLHIVSSTEHHQIRVQGTNDKHAWIQFYPSSSGVLNWQIGANTNGYSIYDITSSKYRLTVANSGNVGVGTSGPQDLFHLVGNNPTVRLSSSTYYGGTGGDLNAILSTIKFSNRDDNHDYRAEIRGLLTGGWATSVGLAFTTYAGGNQVERMRIMHNGNIGIGTNDPQSKLAVDGQIRATEVKVLADISVPDYVFEPDYELRSLKETKEYISENKHLPEIPSAAEIGENGIDLGDMNMRLLKKIEELTLYQIELLEKVEELQSKVEKLENK